MRAGAGRAARGLTDVVRAQQASTKEPYVLLITHVLLITNDEK
jgi:hypothetical protein